MSVPCKDRAAIAPRAIHHYEFFKWLIFGMLGVLLLGLLARGCAYDGLAAPTIVGPSAEIDPQAVTLSGTGSPNSFVDVSVNDQQFSRVPVDGNGSWSVETGLLEPGDYSASAIAWNPDGNDPNKSASTAWAVAAPMAFAAPTLSLPGGDIDPSAVTLTGTGTPGTTVDVHHNGASVGTATVGDDGTWSLTTAVDSYRNDFEAFGLSADGDDIGSSGLAKLLVPGAAAALAFNGLPELGEFAADGDLSVGPINWAGTGEPGANIGIMADGTEIGSVPVDADGNWQFDGSVGLTPGDYGLSAQMTGDNDEVLGQSESAQVTIPQIGMADAGDEGGEDDGDTGAVMAPMPQVRLIEGGTLSSDPVTIYGSAEPGQQVEVLIDGNVAGVVTADENGTWSWNGQLPAGDHTVATRNPGSGNDGIGFLAFSVGEGGAAGVTIDSVETSDNGDVTVTGSGPADAPINIYVDDSLTDKTNADGAGGWVWNGQIGEGPHTISARTPAQAIAGDDGAVAEVGTGDDAPEISSAPRSFGIGQIGTGPAVERPLVTINSIEGGATSGDDVVISGSALPGATVQIVIDGAVVDVVTADDDGNWTWTGQYPAGEHTVVARDLDPDNGRVRIATFNQPFTVGEAVASNEPGSLRILFSGEPDGPITSEDGSSVAIEGEFLSGSPAVEIIYDSSWSMTLDLSGNNRLTAADANSRIGIARDALEEVIGDVIPANTPVALRAFGNIEGNLACRTDLMEPIQPLNKASMIAAVDAIAPQFNANTAIAASLEKVAEDMAGVSRPKIVVLMTDGEETCGGDPAAAIQSLVDQGIDVRVNIVGFAIANDDLRAEFERWAELGGGQYYDAQDADALAGAMSEILVTRYRVVDSDGQPVTAGIVGGLPVELPAGTYSIEITGAQNVVINDVEVGAGDEVEIAILE